MRSTACIAAAVACLGVLAPSAGAATTTIRFNNGGSGPASVVVSDNRTTRDGYIELVRGREVIARSADRDGIGASSGHLNVPNLLAGDVARAYGDGVAIAAAAYDGGPRIGPDACAGSPAFTVARPAGAPVVWVGAYLTGGELVPGQGLQWADAGSFTVAAAPALVAGQSLRVLTRREEGPVAVESRTSGVIGACPPAAPTDAQVLTATRRAVAATGAKLGTLDVRRLAVRATVALPFAFSEPGGVCLELRDDRGVLIGTGARRMRSAGTADVRVAWTVAGRRLLRGARRARMTLTASFAPARAGAPAQNGSTRVH